MEEMEYQYKQLKVFKTELSIQQFYTLADNMTAEAKG